MNYLHKLTSIIFIILLTSCGSNKDSTKIDESNNSAEIENEAKESKVSDESKDMYDVVFDTLSIDTITLDDGSKALRIILFSDYIGSIKNMDEVNISKDTPSGPACGFYKPIISDNSQQINLSINGNRNCTHTIYNDGQYVMLYDADENQPRGIIRIVIRHIFTKGKEQK